MLDLNTCLTLNDLRLLILITLHFLKFFIINFAFIFYIFYLFTFFYCMTECLYVKHIESALCMKSAV